MNHLLLNCLFYHFHPLCCFTTNSSSQFTLYSLSRFPNPDIFLSTFTAAQAKHEEIVPSLLFLLIWPSSSPFSFPPLLFLGILLAAGLITGCHKHLMFSQKVLAAPWGPRTHQVRGPGWQKTDNCISKQIRETHILVERCWRGKKSTPSSSCFICALIGQWLLYVALIVTPQRAAVQTNGVITRT